MGQKIYQAHPEERFITVRKILMSCSQREHLSNKNEAEILAHDSDYMSQDPVSAATQIPWQTQLTLLFTKKTCGFHTFLLLWKFVAKVKQCRRLSNVFQDSRIRNSYSTKKWIKGYYNVKSDWLTKVTSGSLGIWGEKGRGCIKLEMLEGAKVFLWSGRAHWSGENATQMWRKVERQRGRKERENQGWRRGKIHSRILSMSLRGSFQTLAWGGPRAPSSDTEDPMMLKLSTAKRKLEGAYCHPQQGKWPQRSCSKIMHLLLITILILKKRSWLAIEPVRDGLPKCKTRRLGN